MEWTCVLKNKVSSAVLCYLYLEVPVCTNLHLEFVPHFSGGYFTQMGPYITTAKFKSRPAWVNSDTALVMGPCK